MTARSKSFPNLAGHESPDSFIAEELGAAKIEITRLPVMLSGEVSTKILGGLGPWTFSRAWRYWIAKGPGIPHGLAEELHASWGREVRVDGHCGCPSPSEWFGRFGVGHYHIDTQDGLNALSETIHWLLLLPGERQKLEPREDTAEPETRTEDEHDGD